MEKIINLLPLLGNGFWSDFCSNFLATLIGVFVALWLDRIFINKQRKESEKELQYRKYKLLLLIYKEINENLRRITDIKSGIPEKPIFFITPEADKLESISTIRNQLLDNQINFQLDQIEIAMKRLANKIDLDIQAKFSAYGDTPEYKNSRHGLFLAMENDVDGLLTMIPQLKFSIRNLYPNIEQDLDSKEYDYFK
jgi:hypothetical protein